MAKKYPLSKYWPIIRLKEDLANKFEAKIRPFYRTYGLIRDIFKIQNQIALLWLYKNVKIKFKKALKA